MSTNFWIGKTIAGRYQIANLLGQGGMSAVYKAVDANLKREVAVKLIHTHLSTDPAFLDRFECEAQAVAQLRHANIVQVYDFNHEDDVYYMVQEYVPGETLQARLLGLNQANQAMPFAEALQFMIEICGAVEYAHQRGIIHRDIKPANIMIETRSPGESKAILMDFGIVKILGGEKHTATGAVVGTACYMPPEIVRGEAPDGRSDIYSLGVTLFEMVSGSVPFNAESAVTIMMMHLNNPVPDLNQLRPGIPPELKACIEKALAKQRQQRFASAQEMAEALKKVLSGLSGAELPGSRNRGETPDAWARVASVMLPNPAALPAVESESAQPVPATRTSLHPILYSLSGAAIVGLMLACLAVGFLASRGLFPYGSQTPGLLAAATEAPISASTAESTPTVVSLATPSHTPASDGALPPDAPSVTTRSETACLEGPGETYPQTTLLPANHTALLEGISIDELWLLVQSATETGAASCWLPTLAAIVQGDLSQVPLVEPTLIPTPNVFFVEITAITLDEQGYFVVDFTATNFQPAIPGTHIHFYFNTVPVEQVGMGGSGERKMHGSASPFTGFHALEMPPGATSLCAVVANPNHAIHLNSGNCFALPEIPPELLEMLQDSDFSPGTTDGYK